LRSENAGFTKSRRVIEEHVSHPIVGWRRVSRTAGAWCVMKESESFPCCSKDESRSLGFGDQKLEPNHPMRHSLRAIVVSDREKAVQELSGTY
jgi:hypothetical protein